MKVKKVMYVSSEKQGRTVYYKQFRNGFGEIERVYLTKTQFMMFTNPSNHAIVAKETVYKCEVPIFAKLVRIKN